jgi:hypothetical protein
MICKTIMRVRWRLARRLILRDRALLARREPMSIACSRRYKWIKKGYFHRNWVQLLMIKQA